jgi:hypothetical protein
MKIDNSLLAPYGSMKFARLATKVGQIKQNESEGVLQKETLKSSNRAAEQDERSRPLKSCRVKAT